MSAKHTPEPWMAEKAIDVNKQSKWIITTNKPFDMVAIVSNRSSRTMHNARRIVACVNACAGIPTEVLEAPDTTGEGMARKLWSHYDQVLAINEQIKQQRDELLAALENLYEAYCSEMKSEYDFPGRPWTPERDDDLAAINARAALAKVKESA